MTGEKENLVLEAVKELRSHVDKRFDVQAENHALLSGQMHSLAGRVGSLEHDREEDRKRLGNVSGGVRDLRPRVVQQTHSDATQDAAIGSLLVDMALIKQSLTSKDSAGIEQPINLARVAHWSQRPAVKHVVMAILSLIAAWVGAHAHDIAPREPTSIIRDHQ